MAEGKREFSRSGNAPLVAASARGSRYRFRLTEVRRRRDAHRGSRQGGYSLGVGEIGEVTRAEAGEKAHQTRGSVGGISWGGWAGKGWEKRRDGERTGRNGRGGVPGGVRARRERGGVGKGARGVVQFRVGITLDFRGDVATSPALALPVATLLLLLSSTFGGLQPHRPLPHLRVLCFAISAREGHPPLVLQGKSTHPDYLGKIDPSAFATLYTVHGTNISRRMIFLLLLPSVPTWPFVDGQPYGEGRALVMPNIPFFSSIIGIIKN